MLTGLVDTELNERGKAQAAAVGKRLADEPIDKIYCSDLLRCKQARGDNIRINFVATELITHCHRQTAEAIIPYHAETPIIFLESIRERGFGNLQGHPLSHIARKSSEQKLSFDELVKAEGGELESEFEKRVISGYQEIVNDALARDYKHILVVTHGGPLRALTHHWTYHAQYKNISSEDIRSHGNTAVTRVRASRDLCGTVEFVGCIKHLQDQVQVKAPPAV